MKAGRRPLDDQARDGLASAGRHQEEEKELAGSGCGKITVRKKRLQTFCPLICIKWKFCWKMEIFIAFF